ncbi:coiled-coil domain containing 124 family protein [Cystoisospora suis]|uniref:Coiled-coil domain containing 124 family protein n=1 Tax=Cystoisospora suis TaxID=483139 RepID=A0A2C6KEP0_9APIC|nr:coiled-coil domain containing 124 family protein [Cystoisospora suis]
MAPTTNHRAVEARERKAQAAAEAARAKAEEAERRKWEDNDKSVARKTERKAAALQKAEERAQHKAELRRLAAEEDAAFARNTQQKNAAPAKLTRAQIQQRALLAAAAAKKAEAVEEKVVDEVEIQPNINHLIRQQTLQMRDSGVEVVSASSVAEALAAMSIGEPTADRHPERRMKAAFKAYEDVWMPRLKAENPSLKRSQLMEMLNKQWRKAPENPMNQAAAAGVGSPSSPGLS